jgi:predicted protein tyrosine phosphatase
MTQLIPNFWIGTDRDAEDAQFLKRHVDIVINCSTDIPFNSSVLDELNIAYLRVPVNDAMEPADNQHMLFHLPKITEFIWNSLIKGRRILVHCNTGKQRAATIAAAYLIKYLKLTVQQAVSAIQTKRIICFTPRCNFEKALLAFEQQCLPID